MYLFGLFDKRMGFLDLVYEKKPLLISPGWSKSMGGGCIHRLSLNIS